MNNLDKYSNVFTDTFSVDKNELNGLTYQSISDWDSVGHMSLIAALEEKFDIMFDTEDIIDFSSFDKGKELLRKYEIEF